MYVATFLLYLIINYVAIVMVTCACIISNLCPNAYIRRWIKETTREISYHQVVIATHVDHLIWSLSRYIRISCIMPRRCYTINIRVVTYVVYILS